MCKAKTDSVLHCCRRCKQWLTPATICSQWLIIMQQLKMKHLMGSIRSQVKLTGLVRSLTLLVKQ